MGAWGAGLFSDDLALDVRGTWEDHLNETGDGADATRRTVESFASSAEDPDERATFWIALAMTQWKWGRLEEHVRARAVALIDSGDGLRGWQDADPRLLPKRRAALAKARATLASPPPPAERIRKRRPEVTPFELGDLVELRLPDGRLALFVVVAVRDSSDGRQPILVQLDWIGTEPCPVDKARLLQPMGYGLNSTTRRIPFYPTEPVSWRSPKFDRNSVRIVARQLMTTEIIPSDREAFVTCCTWASVAEGVLLREERREAIRRGEQLPDSIGRETSLGPGWLANAEKARKAWLAIQPRWP